MMYTYGTMLTLILLSLIGVAISVYVLRSDVRDAITKEMAKSLKNYNEPEHRGVTETWDFMQKNFKCCGVNNYTDWEGTPAFTNTGNVPDTCCKKNTEGCGKGASISTDKIYTTGCFVKFENFIIDNAAATTGVGVGIIFLLFFGSLRVLLCCQGI